MDGALLPQRVILQSLHGPTDEAISLNTGPISKVAVCISQNDVEIGSGSEKNPDVILHTERCVYTKQGRGPRDRPEGFYYCCPYSTAKESEHNTAPDNTQPIGMRCLDGNFRPSSGGFV